MTSENPSTTSEALNLEDLNSDFLSLRIGEEIQKLEIGRIRKITNPAKQDNLPGVDFKYLFETKDGKLLKVNSWILWNAIAKALREAGKIQATLYLCHNDFEDYTIKVL